MIFHHISSLNVSLDLGSKLIFVGRLAYKNRQIWFEYDQKFLSLDIDLSPFKLPPRNGVFMGDNRIFDGLFGLFNDSLPDGWGRLLLDKELEKRGISHSELTPIDRLAFVGQTAMGALCYEPDYKTDHVKIDKINLDMLSLKSKKVLDGVQVDAVADLLPLNSSAMGARPKIMVGVSDDKKNIVGGLEKLPDNFSHWIVKFTSKDDLADSGKIEFAYSLMAKEAGIIMPNTHLFKTSKGGCYFGVERFDRQHNNRVHVHSIAGLLEADHRVPSLDYSTILSAVLTLSKSVVDLENVYRQCVFNLMAYNRDDHSKNFAMIMNHNQEWHLSPAYDLMFSAGPGGEHSTTILGEGRNPSLSHLLNLAEKFRIKNATQIIDQVQASVLKWLSHAEKAEISKQSRNMISNYLNSLDFTKSRSFISKKPNSSKNKCKGFGQSA